MKEKLCECWLPRSILPLAISRVMRKKFLFLSSRAREIDADVVLFPELTLSGYPPEDLLLDASFIDALQKKLQEIAPATKGLFAVIGLPRWNESGIEKPLYNSAAVFQDGKLLGFHDKQLLPTYDVFDEMRFFQPGERPSIFEHMGQRIAVTICEDLWQHSHTVGYTNYRDDPVKELQEQEIDLVLNLSASPYYYRRERMRLHAFSSLGPRLASALDPVQSRWAPTISSFLMAIVFISMQRASSFTWRRVLLKTRF